MEATSQVSPAWPASVGDRKPIDLAVRPKGLQRIGRRQAGDRSGFSLLEVLVAMSLMTFVALSVAPLMLLGLQVSTATQEMTDLLLTSTDQMEFLRTLAYQDPMLMPGGAIDASLEGYSMDPLGGDANRYLRWEVEEISQHMKYIRVVTGTREAALGPPRQVLVETYRTDIR